MNPIDIGKTAITAVGHDTASAAADGLRPFFCDAAQQRTRGEVRAHYLAHLVRDNIRHRFELRIDAVRDQMRLAAAFGNIPRQSVVGPIHPSFLDEISSDNQVRLHRPRIWSGPAWRLAAAAANRTALSIQNSIPI